MRKAEIGFCGGITINIYFICVGKIKESYYLSAQKEYAKMLSRFAQVQVVEVADEPLQHIKSEKEEEIAKDAEGKRILEKCAGGFIIACDPKGKKFTSTGFAKKLEECMLQGASSLYFVVGGSLGLGEEVKKRADLLLSFSDMVMPHRLFRIVLMEQVYRAQKIMHNETYHK